MRTPVAQRIALVCLAPHLWIGATVALFALAATLDYVAKSAVADRLLAIRLGPPAPVAIERFDAGRDLHDGGEISVLAEIASGPVETVSGPEGDLVLLPLHAVGEPGRALADLRDGRIDPRPPARPDGSRRAIVGHLAIPVSFAPGVVPFRPIGAGRDGLVVAISGRMAGPGLLEVLPGGHAGRVFVPFQRSREVALAPVQQAGGPRLPFVLSILCGIVAAATTLRVRSRESTDDSWQAPAPSRTLRFQPIASQSEMSDGLDKTEPRAAGVIERVRRLMPRFR